MWQTPNIAETEAADDASLRAALGRLFVPEPASNAQHLLLSTAFATPRRNVFWARIRQLRAHFWLPESRLAIMASVVVAMLLLGVSNRIGEQWIQPTAMGVPSDLLLADIEFADPHDDPFAISFEQWLLELPDNQG
jgi:hypothetical protein